LRILLTRPEGRNEKLAGPLRTLGHDVVCEPLIAIEPLGDELIELGGYDWVIVTSVSGACELRRRGRGRPGRTAAIGHATANALGGADLVPEVSTQEGLLEALPRPAGRVLFAGAEGARRMLVDELGADFQPLYRTRELVPETLPQADLAVVASASAARALGALKLDIPIVSIGPETTKAAEAVGARVVEEARTHDLSGLVDAVTRATR
jgi:uroporphyrinogen-III synthase